MKKKGDRERYGKTILSETEWKMSSGIGRAGGQVSFYGADFPDASYGVLGDWRV